MKKVFILIVIVLTSFSILAAGNLTTSQLVTLAKSKTISEISSIASNNGYKLQYKKSGAKGWENYDVTDMAWAYNATYLPSINNWEYTGSFSAIKLLYNNKDRTAERIVYVLSSGTDFHTIKNQISSYGFQFYQEDVNTFKDAIAYCYYNENLRMYAIFAEYFNNGGYQIHFYRD